MIKPLPGSIRVVKVFKNVINEVLKRKCILVLESWPTSYIIPELLNENEIGFVLPLKRNFVIMDYNMPLRQSFIFEDRGLNWANPLKVEALQLEK